MRALRSVVLTGTGACSSRPAAGPLAAMAAKGCKGGVIWGGGGGVIWGVIRG